MTSLRRQLLVSFGVQGAGAASVLLATLWLGARFGPEVQGGFNRSKTELEFVAAFAMFGLPQALFFHVKSGRMRGRDALRWVLGGLLLALPIGALYAVAVHARAAAEVLALAAAVAACVAHGQMRPLLLVRDRTVWFNAATALPQVLVLAGVGIVAATIAVPAGTASTGISVTWMAVFGLAYATAALLAWRRLKRSAVADTAARHRAADAAGAEDTDTAIQVAADIDAAAAAAAIAADALADPVVPANVATAARADDAVTADPVTADAAASVAAEPHRSGQASVGWRALGQYGLAAWLTAALATAALLSMQRWVESAAGPAALGRFALAMAWMQVPLTPVSYAAPLLLRRWMEQPGAVAARRWSARLFVVLAGLAALVALAARHRPDLGLGSAYAGTTQALALLLVGGAAEAASRVLTVQAGASGLPWRAVRAESARCGVLALGWLLLPPTAGLLPLCAVWSAGAIAALLVLAAHRSNADAR